MLTTYDFLKRSYEDTLKLRQSVGVVCCGDGLTGYSNCAPPDRWPTPCYPEVLDDLLAEAGYRKTVACYGYAGETSGTGTEIVSRCLDMFAHATFVVIGFGTNDMAAQIDTRKSLQDTLANIDQMTHAVIKERKIPILLGAHGIDVQSIDNVLVGGSLPEFNDSLCRLARSRLKYLNEALATYAERKRVAFIDVTRLLEQDASATGLQSLEATARSIAAEVFKQIQHFQSLLKNNAG